MSVRLWRRLSRSMPVRAYAHVDTISLAKLSSGWTAGSAKTASVVPPRLRGRTIAYMGNSIAAALFRSDCVRNLSKFEVLDARGASSQHVRGMIHDVRAMPSPVTRTLVATSFAVLLVAGT